MPEPTYYKVDSPLGEIRIYAVDSRPAFVSLPGNEAPGKMEASPPPDSVRELIKVIEEYFRGVEVSFRYAKKLADALRVTPFEQAVLMEVARIPRGETRSYGEIAELTGHPRAARAVGNVMHGNPFPVVIPCHRVIKSDGGIGGYGGAEHLKAWLLRFEGWKP